MTGVANMITGFAVTLDILLLAGLIISAAAMGSAALRGYQLALQHRQGEPVDTGLHAVIREADLICQIVANSRGKDAQSGKKWGRHIVQNRDAVVHAQIEPLDPAPHVWDGEARREAMERVADIMKRSVRHAGRYDGQSGDTVDQIEGEGFVIVVRNAGEHEAGIVARRLRRELADAQIEGLTGKIRFSARLGVSMRRMSESLHEWRKPTQKAAGETGDMSEADLVEANIIEERMQLPAPSPGMPDRSQRSQAA